MKKLLIRFRSLIYSLCELAVGILIIVVPFGFTSAVVRLMGIALCVAGTACCVSYFKMSPEEGTMTQNLSIGLLLILFGVFCVFNPEWLVGIFPVFARIWGILILVIGFIKLQWAVDTLRNREKYWFISLLGAGSSMLLASIIIANPFATVHVGLLFAGAALIVEAIIDFVNVVFENKAFRDKNLPVITDNSDSDGDADSCS